MDIIERFLNYTKFDTQSAEDSQTVPSTSKQLIFAEYLKKELESIGLDDVELDDKGYLYATLVELAKGLTNLVAHIISCHGLKQFSIDVILFCSKL